MRIICICGGSMNVRLPASASKRPANVSVRAELLDKAKHLGINLSRTLEDRLAELGAEAEARAHRRRPGNPTGRSGRLAGRAQRRSARGAGFPGVRDLTTAP